MSLPQPGSPPLASIPRLLIRRGRITVRHFVALLAGGFVAWVASRRRLGAGGLLFVPQRLIAGAVSLFVDRQLASQPFPVQLRLRLESLGPTYIKLGQILSLRSDILPEVVTEELRNLLCLLPAVAFAEIREIIEADLGRPLDVCFAAVDEIPLASASIAQAHTALTHDGKRVIIKVVKPGIRELLYRDATLLRGFGIVLQMLMPRFQPRRIIDEFFAYTLHEIEMDKEAENAETFAAHFKDLPEVVFPQVYRELSGDRVLCMEYLEGIQPDAPEARALPLDQRTRLIDLGAQAIIRMLYLDGFFHADLHPGNLLILEGARVGFIDLGMVGRLDLELRRHLLFEFHCLLIEDFESAARHLSAVADLGPKSDVVGFRRAVKELCRRWRRSATFKEFSLAQLILESVRLGARYNLYFPVEMVLMVKALITYEGVGYLLDPSFNVAEVSTRHASTIFRRHFSPLRMIRDSFRGAPDLMDTLVKLPVLVSEALRLLEQRTRRRPEGPLTGIRATIFGGFCLVSGAILAAFKGPWLLWSSLLILGLLLPLRRSK